MLKLFPRAKRPAHKRGHASIPVYASLLGVLLCMVCLAGTTWAWFTANQTVSVGAIASAEWTLDSVSVQPSVELTVGENSVSFAAQANTRYTVRVSAKGTATKGFLTVATCDGTFCSTGTQSEFTLLLSQSGTVTVTASWGEPDSRIPPFSGGAQLGSGALVCACTDLCGETPNGGCAACLEAPANCVGSAPPVCTCEEKCTEPNGGCLLCANGTDGCTGTVNDAADPETPETP